MIERNKQDLSNQIYTKTLRNDKNANQSLIAIEISINMKILSLLQNNTIEIKTVV